MAPRTPIRALLGALVALAGPACRLHADLAQASPFLPPNTPASAAGGGVSGPIELRGMMATDQGVACCIYDTAKKTSVWVGVNEPGNDFVVRSVNPADDTATVSYQGRNLQLAMRASKVVSSGTAVAAPPAGFMGGPGGPAVAPSAADEQKRLEAVAAEVRRRRLERERAFQSPGAPPPPAPNR